MIDRTTLRMAVVDDEPVLCRRLQGQFQRKGFVVETFLRGNHVLERMKEASFDLVLLDIRMPDINGMEVLRRIKDRHPQTEVIMITGYSSIEDAVESVKIGAFYYIQKPFTPKQLAGIVQRAVDKLRLKAENRALKEALSKEYGFHEMVGISSVMREVLRSVTKVAPIDCNVLIQGESGTGKELIARAIHFNSPRREKPFIAFNCGGFTEELIANELFGHEKGAFTGADSVKMGLLETANGGTLFLDEIGEMPISMQVKLLRVLQERKLYRVGGTIPVDLDIRIISATNSELEQEVAKNTFRKDLYYRLKVVQIKVPPLRERKEDIPILIHHFLERYNHLYKKRIEGVSKDAMEILLRYSYPGNVRELENIVSSAVALAEGSIIQVDDLPDDLERLEVETFPAHEYVPLEKKEKEYILEVLKATRFNKVKAAKILNIPRTTLWRKIKKYGLDNL